MVLVKIIRESEKLRSRYVLMESRDRYGGGTVVHNIARYTDVVFVAYV